MIKTFNLKLKLVQRLAIFLMIVAILSASLPSTAEAVFFSGFFSFFAPKALAEEASSLPISDHREAKKFIVAVVTAYSSTPDQTDDTPFITANGLRVYDGLIAANWLPFGTQVKFPDLFGDKIFTVNDRMNEKYGFGRVDIWMDAPKDEVREFGVKRLKMEIY